MWAIFKLTDFLGTIERKLPSDCPPSFLWPKLCSENRFCHFSIRILFPRVSPDWRWRVWVRPWCRCRRSRSFAQKTRTDETWVWLRRVASSSTIRTDCFVRPSSSWWCCGTGWSWSCCSERLSSCSRRSFRKEQSAGWRVFATFSTKKT